MSDHMLDALVLSGRVTINMRAPKRRWYLVNNLPPEERLDNSLGAPFSEGDGWGIRLGMDDGLKGDGVGHGPRYPEITRPILMTDRTVEGHMINNWLRSL